MGKTLFEKIWDKHVVRYIENETAVLYIDRHYIHEVTSPQAFNAIEKNGLKIFRPEKTTATADHNVPTVNQHLPISEKLSRIQVEQLEINCKKHNIQLFNLQNEHQGIVHVIGPELGLTLPGSTIVCGDSHTSTHGALGAIAFGIGTSEIEQVFASQCIIQNKPKTLKINVTGKLQKGVTAKDVILYIISKISTSGATGYFIEYCGETISNFSMEERMTICNMSIEMGARGGLISPDSKTIEYLKNKKFAPTGYDFELAKENWSNLFSDADAKFDRELFFSASEISPMVSYGTNPGMAISVSENIPLSNSLSGSEKISFANSLNYMNFYEGEKLVGKKIDYVFIGSCTNSRIEDLRSAAEIIKGKAKSANVIAWVVPGSKKVEQQAIAEGIDKIFTAAGFEFRQPGCSACLGMNEDKIPEGKYCVSTSNRNFEGRQGKGARTILASPIMAAIAAIKGEITDVRNYLN